MWIEFSEFNLKILILLIFPVSKRVQDYTKKAYLVKDHQYLKHLDILQVMFLLLYLY